MSDPGIDGILYRCAECRRPVRLYGHNRVDSWTCEPCRRGETPDLIEASGVLEETAVYDPAVASFPEGF